MISQYLRFARLKAKALLTAILTSSMGQASTRFILFSIAINFVVTFLALSLVPDKGLVFVLVAIWGALPMGLGYFGSARILEAERPDTAAPAFIASTAIGLFGAGIGCSAAAVLVAILGIDSPVGFSTSGVAALTGGFGGVVCAFQRLHLWV